MPVAKPPSPAAHYTVRVADAAAHRFGIELTIAQPAAMQRVSLPVWIPGSYLVREFERHLSGLHAAQGRSACPLHQVDKTTWDIACNPKRPLLLRYEVYAFDNSVRAAWLDAQRGFFNGTGLLLRVHGQQTQPHTLTLQAPRAHPNWHAATAMTALEVDAHGFGTYQCASYDELVDHPVEMGTFWSGTFEARGIPHRFVVACAPPAFDGQRLLRDAQRICETVIDFWRSDPAQQPDRYLFMLNAVDGDYGGLEHRNSTALICGRRDLPRSGKSGPSGTDHEGYTTLLGLISHEYFHAWNIKRLKPVELAQIDYTRENYTRLLWFFEGFTSYYDDLLLRRAGLLDDVAYFKLLTKTLNQVLQAPGRHVQSVAQASFDAWVRFYRQDENTPNSTVSYYTKGALVALCFDLTLRQEGRTTLDEVMRALWRHCQGGPMHEGDFAAVLAELAGRSFEREISAWVHGTDDLPVRPLLQAQGIQVRDEPSQWAQALGLRVSESGGRVVLKVVLDGGPAAHAGMAAGDEWLGIELSASATPGRTRTVSAAQGWRLTRVDDVPLYAGDARTVTALVARDARLLRLPLMLPQQPTTWRLIPPDSSGPINSGSDRTWPGC
ncbi:M61 family metallopeptidase [Ottowia sp.]|uniref:M61 family metallopeptidase n=1 Tax=Ottowia sp. TaxID=1898956 RepID=UPI003A8BF7C5